MVDQHFNGALHANINSERERDRLESALSGLAAQMNGYSSRYSYAAYSTETHGWAARPPQHPGNGAGPREYLKSFAEAVARAHRNNELVAFDGDVWVILDGFDVEYGYGDAVQAVPVDLDGDGRDDSRIYPCRALSTGNSVTLDPLRVTNSMVIHEVAHLFGADHFQGGYERGAMQTIRDVSPMATTYVRAINGTESDTCLAGGETPPRSFRCFGQPNFVDVGYCGLCSNYCRHTLTMTECTMSQIESNTPL